MNAEVKYISAIVIDDESFMCKLIAFQLRALGCQSVLCYESGKDALSYLLQGASDIQLVICDLNMPIMDGVEVVRQLGGMGYQGALILVSGEDQRILKMAEKLAYAHGLRVLGVLKKPINPVRLAWMFNLLAPDCSDGISHKESALAGVSPSQLASAIETGQLVNYYQPKVCLRTGRVMGMESLVRWQHPENGLIHPDAFIAVAEQNGLINQLTRAVIAGQTGVMQQLKHWLDAGLNMHVAVNLSIDNLMDLSFPDFMEQVSNDTNVSLTHLIVEVTESCLNADVRFVADVFTRLRLKRVRLSVDDFGTGYSSLAQLNDLSFDELKINRKFVHQAHRDHVINSILDASLSMAHNLKLSTTGEGVETLEDWLHLQRKGCDLAQGYWIAKPMASECVLPWVEAWTERVAMQPELFGNVPEGVSH
jgi:EAL domain-containing protein (putative c-di-GMP-specific phosphodiesterase class I)